MGSGYGTRCVADHGVCGADAVPGVGGTPAEKSFAVLGVRGGLLVRGPDPEPDPGINRWPALCSQRDIECRTLLVTGGDDGGGGGGTDAKAFSAS